MSAEDKSETLSIVSSNRSTINISSDSTERMETPPIATSPTVTVSTGNGIENKGFVQDEKKNGEFEAVNLELVDLNKPATPLTEPRVYAPPHTPPPQKFSDYYVSVNEHKKGLRGEKLYVTKDSRRGRGCKRYCCALLVLLVIAATVTIASLVGTGVINTQPPFKGEIHKSGRSRDLPPINDSLISDPPVPVIDNSLDDSGIIKESEILPRDAVPHVLEGELSIMNAAWDDRLRNASDPFFKDLAAKVESALLPIFVSPSKKDRAEFYINVNEFERKNGVTPHYRLGWEMKDNSYSDGIDLITKDEMSKMLKDHIKSNDGRLTAVFDVPIESIRVKRVADDKCSQMECQSFCAYDYPSNRFRCGCSETFKLAEDEKSCIKDSTDPTSDVNLLHAFDLTTESANLEDDAVIFEGDEYTTSVIDEGDIDYPETATESPSLHEDNTYINKVPRLLNASDAVLSTKGEGNDTHQTSEQPSDHHSDKMRENGTQLGGSAEEWSHSGFPLLDSFEGSDSNDTHVLQGNEVIEGDSTYTHFDHASNSNDTSDLKWQSVNSTHDETEIVDPNFTDISTEKTQIEKVDLSIDTSSEKAATVFTSEFNDEGNQIIDQDTSTIGTEDNFTYEEVTSQGNLDSDGPLEKNDSNVTVPFVEESTIGDKGDLNEPKEEINLSSDSTNVTEKQNINENLFASDNTSNAQYTTEAINANEESNLSVSREANHNDEFSSHNDEQSDIKWQTEEIITPEATEKSMEVESTTQNGQESIGSTNMIGEDLSSDRVYENDEKTTQNIHETQTIKQDENLGHEQQGTHNFESVNQDNDVVISTEEPNNSEHINGTIEDKLNQQNNEEELQILSDGHVEGGSNDEMTKHSQNDNIDEDTKIVNGNISEDDQNIKDKKELSSFKESSSTGDHPDAVNDVDKMIIINEELETTTQHQTPVNEESKPHGKDQSTMSGHSNISKENKNTDSNIDNNSSSDNEHRQSSLISTNVDDETTTENQLHDQIHDHTPTEGSHHSEDHEPRLIDLNIPLAETDSEYSNENEEKVDFQSESFADDGSEDHGDDINSVPELVKEENEIKNNEESNLKKEDEVVKSAHEDEHSDLNENIERDQNTFIEEKVGSTSEVSSNPSIVSLEEESTIDNEQKETSTLSGQENATKNDVSSIWMNEKSDSNQDLTTKSTLLQENVDPHGRSAHESDSIDNSEKKEISTTVKSDSVDQTVHLDNDWIDEQVEGNYETEENSSEVVKDLNDVLATTQSTNILSVSVSPGTNDVDESQKDLTDDIVGQPTTTQISSILQSDNSFAFNPSEENHDSELVHKSSNEPETTQANNIMQRGNDVPINSKNENEEIDSELIDEQGKNDSATQESTDFPQRDVTLVSSNSETEHKYGNTSSQNGEASDNEKTESTTVPSTIDFIADNQETQVNVKENNDETLDVSLVSKVTTTPPNLEVEEKEPVSTVVNENIDKEILLNDDSTTFSGKTTLNPDKMETEFPTTPSDKDIVNEEFDEGENKSTASNEDSLDLKNAQQDEDTNESKDELIDSDQSTEKISDDIFKDLVHKFANGITNINFDSDIDDSTNNSHEDESQSTEKPEESNDEDVFEVRSASENPSRSLDTSDILNKVGNIVIQSDNDKIETKSRISGIGINQSRNENSIILGAQDQQILSNGSMDPQLIQKIILNNIFQNNGSLLSQENSQPYQLGVQYPNGSETVFNFNGTLLDASMLPSFFNSNNTHEELNVQPANDASSDLQIQTGDAKKQVIFGGFHLPNGTQIDITSSLSPQHLQNVGGHFHFDAEANSNDTTSFQEGKPTEIKLPNESEKQKFVLSQLLRNGSQETPLSLNETQIQELVFSQLFGQNGGNYSGFPNHDKIEKIIRQKLFGDNESSNSTDPQPLHESEIKNLILNEFLALNGSNDAISQLSEEEISKLVLKQILSRSSNFPLDNFSLNETEIQQLIENQVLSQNGQNSSISSDRSPTSALNSQLNNLTHEDIMNRNKELAILKEIVLRQSESTTEKDMGNITEIHSKGPKENKKEFTILSGADFSSQILGRDQKSSRKINDLFDEECKDPENEFKCIGPGGCLPKSLRCNGVYDCRDGSDELLCEANGYVKDECKEFQCPNGPCIPSRHVCDGQIDCLDSFDELNCDESKLNCSISEFYCVKDARCINLSYRCDGTPDCVKEDEDERDCECNSEVEFKCLVGGGCIDKENVCDGFEDCPDLSDEFNCLQTTSEGEIKIRDYSGSWSTLCFNNDTSFELAQAACRQIGFQNAIVQADSFVEEKSFSSFKTFDFASSSVEDGLRIDNNILDNVTVCDRNPKVTCVNNECSKRELSDAQMEELKTQGTINVTSLTVDNELWPSLAYLFNVKRKATCVVTILRPRWLITSHSCLSERSMDPLEWVAFAGPANGHESKTQIKVVKRIISHPSVKFKQGYFTNDLAVIELSDSLEFNDFVQPSCLGHFSKDKAFCFVAGWTDVNQEGVSFRQYMDWVSLPMMPYEECNSKNHYNQLLNKNSLCTSTKHADVPCRGNGGAPLFCHQEDGWRLQGVLSKEGECLSSSHPDVFTSIEEAEPWLVNLIGYKRQ